MMLELIINLFAFAAFIGIPLGICIMGAIDLIFNTDLIKDETTAVIGGGSIAFVVLVTFGADIISNIWNIVKWLFTGEGTE